MGMNKMKHQAINFLLSMNREISSDVLTFTTTVTAIKKNKRIH